MGVAVDEAGHRGEAAAVELLDLTVKRREVLHATDGLDRGSGAEHERVLDDIDLGKRPTAERSR